MVSAPVSLSRSSSTSVDTDMLCHYTIMADNSRHIMLKQLIPSSLPKLKPGDGFSISGRFLHSVRAKENGRLAASRIASVSQVYTNLIPNKAGKETSSEDAVQLAQSSSESTLADQLPVTTNTPHAVLPLRILIAGGGIGGLVLALAAKNRGFQVRVFERDVSAIRGEGQYRGPIQIQSNALAALEEIDRTVAEEVMAAGCITGDRINGLVDGLTGTWYVKFDTYTPAVEKGLPVTRVISRMMLQEILSHAIGSEIIENNANVVDFHDDGSKVRVTLEDGRTVEGDLLVGADGIRSKVRNKLLGALEATYSDYTCYTGIADFVPPDIETVGYRVFLGHKQYFVSSDVGHGKTQWYAFHNEPAGGTDPPGGKKAQLLQLFGHWCDAVVELLLATPEDQILRRDIYDRVPIMTWSKGRVTLLGDSAHAMQPNMGQGGCMAIEDAYQLALELSKAMDLVAGPESANVAEVLKRYESSRRMRVAAIHGMARMAAIMASTYKPYLGEGLGPLSILTKLRIPHPGRVGGKFFFSIAMPIMLGWVLGGNSSALEGRTPSFRLTDKASAKLREWFDDDDALERAISAEWYLVPSGERLPLQTDITESGKKIFRFGKDGRPMYIGRSPFKSNDSDSIIIDNAQVSENHAKIMCVDRAFFITDLQSSTGTWIRNVHGGCYRVKPYLPTRIHPNDTLELGGKEVSFKVRLRKPTSEASVASRGQEVEFKAVTT